MQCQKCSSDQIARVSAKTSDFCSIRLPDGTRKDGYPPYNLGIGGGDYLEFSYCLTCGQIQGAFPVAPTNED